MFVVEINSVDVNNYSMIIRDMHATGYTTPTTNRDEVTMRGY